MLRQRLLWNVCRTIQRRSFSAEPQTPVESLHASGNRPSTSSEYCSGGSEPPTLSTYTEVEIPVPWGHIAGKWWGSQDEVPVLGLHGFEDNAGTYDRLAPQLTLPAFFAWDAPGHGRSSHMPHGHTYHFADFLISLRLLMRHFGWEKVSFIAHSWGSATALTYSGLFPSAVERFVSLDCARTLMPNVGTVGIERLRLIANHIIKCDKTLSKAALPPAYNINDVRKLIVQGTFNSVLAENCDPLIDRGTSPHPETPDTLYFSRDHRLRNGDVCRPTNGLIYEAAKRLRCHVLSLLAKQGFVCEVGDEVQRLYHQQELMMAEGAASYHFHLIQGNHHVHLNNPERVAPLINSFFNEGNKI